MHEFVYNRAKQVQTASGLARECMQRQAKSRALKYDLRVRPARFEVDQLVWYYYPRKRRGIKDKWASWYVGPFKIIEQVGPVLYKIKKSPRAQPKLVYVDRLKAYHGEIPREWSGETVHVDEFEPMEPIPIEELPSPSRRPKREICKPVRYRFDC